MDCYFLRNVHGVQEKNCYGTDRFDLDAEHFWLSGLVVLIVVLHSKTYMWILNVFLNKVFWVFWKTFHVSFLLGLQMVSYALDDQIILFFGECDNWPKFSLQTKGASVVQW